MDSDRGLLELWRISGGVRLLGVSGDRESRFCGLEDCCLSKGFKGGRLRSGFDDTGDGGGGGGRLLVGSLVKAALGVMGEGPLRSETLRPLESSPYIFKQRDNDANPSASTFKVSADISPSAERAMIAALGHWVLIDELLGWSR